MTVRAKTTYNNTEFPPTIGDTSYGDLIGKLVGRRFIWLDCPYCGKERWVAILNGKPQTQRCVQCRQGGSRHKTGDGYIMVFVPRHDFFRGMTTKAGYCLEHRLVMARHLKRCLLPWEIIHHRNGVKDDNRLQNLALLLGQYQHVADTELKRYVRRLEKRIEALENILDVYKYEAGE